MKWFHLLKSVGKMSAMKLTAMSVAAAMAAGSIGAGGYIMYDYENIPQEIETARVPLYCSSVNAIVFLFKSFHLFQKFLFTICFSSYFINALS